MKVIIALYSIFVLVAAEYPSNWGHMVKPCVNVTLDQIGCEIRASLEYFRFGVHFSREDINRPGFSHFFLEAAKEEREHAIKLIEYLTMRGSAKPFDDDDSIGNLMKGAAKCPIFSVGEDCLNNGYNALQCALEMETSVTNHIYKVIRQCELTDCNEKSKCRGKPSMSDEHVYNDDKVYNDYHYVDYLTGEFLEEQYKGQREIAGKLKTLEKLTETHGNIGEFLFDKQFLE